MANENLNKSQETSSYKPDATPSLSNLFWFFANINDWFLLPHSFNWLVCRYMSSLGNKRVELFDMGAGGSEPTAEENVQMASGCNNNLLFLDFQMETFIFQLF